jgi:hypothetical protein
VDHDGDATGVVEAAAQRAKGGVVEAHCGEANHQMSSLNSRRYLS